MAKKEVIFGDTKDLLEIWNNGLEKRLKKGLKLPIFSQEEAEMLTWLLFAKTDEFRAWIIKKEDENAVRRLVEGLEAERYGATTRRGSIYLRRMQFLRELLNSRFNAAEAARRCGYSVRYAKQIGYQIMRKHPFRYL